MMNKRLRTSNEKTLLLAGISILAIVFSSAYLIVRIILLLFGDYAWYEYVPASFALVAELFIVIQGTGYFLEIVNVVKHHKTLSTPKETIPPLTSYPPVMIIMSSYKEPLDVVENTITTFYNLTYPHKSICRLDDTRYDIPWDTPNRMEA